MRCPRCLNHHHFAQDCRFYDTPGGAVLEPPKAAPGASDALEARAEADGARTAASGVRIAPPRVVPVEEIAPSFRRLLPPAEGVGGS